MGRPRPRRGGLFETAPDQHPSRYTPAAGHRPRSDTKVLLEY
ncbi:hypothetical protein BN2537_495 [Streptomyces venezuelae]|nr:hypothetical protein BN2537_495 [Streptomyces venezuelae]